MDNVNRWGSPYASESADSHDPLQPPPPLRPPTMPTAIEDYEESALMMQVMSLKSVGNSPSRSLKRSISEKTGLDSFLKPEKGAPELYRKLAEVFKDDVHSLAGIREHRSERGMFCSYGATYGFRLFSPDAVYEHLCMYERFWSPEKHGNIERITVEPRTRLIVVGDTHGQLEDVLWIFFKYGLPSSSNRYLFNGDIVDRGGHSLEILLLLFAFKRDEPSSVYILRGNHEDHTVFENEGFSAELKYKFPSDWQFIETLCREQVFPWMPLAAIISLERGRYGVLHGGPSSSTSGERRPLDLEQDLCSAVDRTKIWTVQGATMGDSPFLESIFKILWGDPVESMEEKAAYLASNGGRGRRGVGEMTCYMKYETKAFLRQNALDCLIRSHEPSQEEAGCQVHHSGFCVTVFSASNYGGTGAMAPNGGRAGVMIIDSEASRLCDHYAPSFAELAEIIPRFGCSSRSTTVQIVKRFEQPRGVEDIDSPLDAEAEELSAVELARLPRPSPEFVTDRSTQEVLQCASFLRELIVRSQDRLFDAFLQYDPACKGSVSKLEWASTLVDELSPLCQGSAWLTDRIIDELFEFWQLTEPVGYMRFLQRFQIVGDPGKPRSDLMRVASAARRRLLDLSEAAVGELLDQDHNGMVDLSEFQRLLTNACIGKNSLGRWQVATVYETMVQHKFCQDGKAGLSLDDAITCMSFMTREPVPDDRFSDLCQEVGQMLLDQGTTPPAAFRRWDTSKKGFLDLSEIASGLQSMLPSISMDHVEGFKTYCELLGAGNGKVNILEFTRAVTPRCLGLVIGREMTLDLLKSPWEQQSLLRSMLRRCDRDASGLVSVADFKGCLEKMSIHMQEVQGLVPLTKTQVVAIAELASGGGTSIDYDTFLSGLRVIDQGSAVCM